MQLFKAARIERIAPLVYLRHMIDLGLPSARPVTVYLRWEEGELERLAPLVQVLCTSLVKRLIACHDRTQGKGCRPVLLSLDEVARTPIPDLDGYVSTVRSRTGAIVCILELIGHLHTAHALRTV